MKAQLVRGVEVWRGADSVFTDLGLADAEKLKIKTELVIEITSYRMRYPIQF